MKRTSTLAATVTALGLLTGCGSSHGGGPSSTTGEDAACKAAMVQQLRAGVAEGSSASPDTRPPACVEVSDKVVQQYALEAMQEVFGDTNSPVPLPSASAAAQFTIPDLTGMTLDQADALATASGEYTTPETADGNSPTIGNESGWTVCSQSPVAGTTTGSNNIVVTVADTAAGKHC